MAQIPRIIATKNRKKKRDALKPKLQEILHIKTANKTEKFFTGTKTCLRVHTISQLCFRYFYVFSRITSTAKLNTDTASKQQCISCHMYFGNLKTTVVQVT